MLNYQRVTTKRNELLGEQPSCQRLANARRILYHVRNIWTTKRIQHISTYTVIVVFHNNHQNVDVMNLTKKIPLNVCLKHPIFHSFGFPLPENCFLLNLGSLSLYVHVCTVSFKKVGKGVPLSPSQHETSQNIWSHNLPKETHILT
jgi:hypothetical protein